MLDYTSYPYPNRPEQPQAGNLPLYARCLGTKWGRNFRIFQCIPITVAG